MLKVGLAGSIVGTGAAHSAFCVVRAWGACRVVSGGEVQWDVYCGENRRWLGCWWWLGRRNEHPFRKREAGVGTVAG